jgi:cytidine deaminase
LVSNEELIKLAKSKTKKEILTSSCAIGHIGCALETSDGELYFGISIVNDCALGMCSEQSAISSMLLNRKTEIKKIVSVKYDGTVYPACGKCRELIYQINHKNENTNIIIDKTKSIKLKDLLPYNWQNVRSDNGFSEYKVK